MRANQYAFIDLGIEIVIIKTILFIVASDRNSKFRTKFETFFSFKMYSILLYIIVPFSVENKKESINDYFAIEGTSII